MCQGTTLAVQIYRALGGGRNREIASGATLPSGANSRQLGVSGALPPAYERLINKQFVRHRCARHRYGTTPCTISGDTSARSLFSMFNSTRPRSSDSTV
jgi:hypothetical protein